MKMKKINFKGLLVGLLAVSMLAPSCKRYSSDFGDTNDNPNNINEPLLGALLTNVLAGISGVANYTRPGYYCQYFSETQYSATSLYSLPQLQYEGYYSGSMMDLQTIVNKGTNNNMTQVAKILLAYYYTFVSDCWGDVPMSEALQGNGYPVYDSQEDIYKNSLAMLADAVASFDAASGIQGDIVYSGNVTKWRKFANSLRVRLALQLTKKYPSAGGYAATQLQAALNDIDGVITDNADNFKVAYPGGAYQHPWFATYNGRSDIGESDVMVGIMQARTDGRQAMYGSSNLGVPYGWDRTSVDPWQQANTGWARVLQASLRTESSTAMILSASEVYLNRAEAADRGWTGEDMNAMYKAGINASFAQWGVAAPSNSYFAQANVALGSPAGSAANVQNIVMQQYIAAYPDGMRGWNIWRRTGYPVLVPARDATNSSGQIVRRFVYDAQTYGTNPDATNAAAGAIPGGDTQDSKVWWDR